MLARLLAAKGDLAAAIKTVDTIATDRDDIRLFILGQSAEWCLALGKATEAEKRLKQVVAIQPADPRANDLLHRILNAKGRRYESLQYTKKFVELGSYQLSNWR